MEADGNGWEGWELMGGRDGIGERGKIYHFCYRERNKR